MKTFKNIFLTLLVGLFGLSFNLSAQRIQVVTPSNSTASAQEVMHILGGRINVSIEEIRDFYLERWDGANHEYSPSCQEPDASVKNEADGHMRFQWKKGLALSSGVGLNVPTSAPTSYIVSYLRLSDGVSDSIRTSENSIDLFLPDDSYIVVFQKQCGSVTSALGIIIIIEKPIFTLVNDRDCNCVGSQLIWESEASLIDPSFVSRDWEHTNYTEKYYALVELSGGPSASFIGTVEFGAEGPEHVFLDSECMTNVDLNEDKTFVFMHEPNRIQDHLGVFGFSGNNSSLDGAPQFSFNLAENSPYTIEKVYLYTCTNLLRNETASDYTTERFQDISFKSLANPFKTSLAITYTLPKQESISITLFNALGEQLQVLKSQSITEAGSYQLDLDVADLPDGVYFCVLKTPETTIPLKLLKQD